MTAQSREILARNRKRSAARAMETYLSKVLLHHGSCLSAETIRLMHALLAQVTKEQK